MVSVEAPYACINICAHVNIPNTGSHSIVWTHESSTHSDMNRYIALLLRLLSLTRGRGPEFPTRDSEVLNTFRLCVLLHVSLV